MGNMKKLFILFISLSLFFCSPKGPVTYKSSFVGQSKTTLINAKGIAKTIKVFDESEAYVYKVKEEYFGKKSLPNPESQAKKTFITEHIYYINNKGIVYKYQVWKKRVR